MPRSLASTALFALAGHLAACGAPPPAAAPAPPAPAPPAAPPAPPAFQLVETAPIETTLDHADLPDASDVWLQMIVGAKRSIDLAQFYASNQQPGRLEPVVRALEAAVARGVRVRFLAEQSFVKVYPDTLERLARAGAAVRHLDLRAVPGAGGILHAKYFVVDDRDAFFGSQNFDWRALEHNYELGARTTDAAVVGGLVAIFAADWARAGGEPALAAASLPVASPAPHAPITFVASPPELNPPGVPWDLPRIVALLDSATRAITVEALTYYAGPGGGAEGAWDELEAPLIRAARRGVQVELLLADWSKRPRTIAGLQKLARIPNISVKLTTIPVAGAGFIPFSRVTHAKALVVDGVRGWLGTSNWEREYFYKSRNVGAIIEDRAIAGQLARFFATLWQSPYAVAVDPDASYTPPRIE